MVALSRYVPPFCSSALYANYIVFRRRRAIVSARRGTHVAKCRTCRHCTWCSPPLCRHRFDTNAPFKLAATEEEPQHCHSDEDDEDSDEITYEGPRRGSRTRTPRGKGPKTVAQVNAEAQPRREKSGRSIRGMPAPSPNYHYLNSYQ